MFAIKRAHSGFWQYGLLLKRPEPNNSDVQFSPYRTLKAKHEFGLRNRPELWVANKVVLLNDKNLMAFFPQRAPRFCHLHHSIFPWMPCHAGNRYNFINGARAEADPRGFGAPTDNRGRPLRAWTPRPGRDPTGTGPHPPTRNDQVCSVDVCSSKKIKGGN